MAEYYFNSEFKNPESIKAESCGLCADGGRPMAKNAQTVLEMKGIYAKTEHISRQIDEEMVRNADFIYGITVYHEASLKERFPKFADKIKSLPEDIGDPYGGSLEIYEKCFDGIKRSVDMIIETLTGENMRC